MTVDVEKIETEIMTVDAEEIEMDKFIVIVYADVDVEDAVSKHVQLACVKNNN